MMMVPSQVCRSNKLNFPEKEDKYKKQRKANQLLDVPAITACIPPSPNFRLEASTPFHSLVQFSPVLTVYSPVQTPDVLDVIVLLDCLSLCSCWFTILSLKECYIACLVQLEKHFDSLSSKIYPK